jgi:hypothetical protein
VLCCAVLCCRLTFRVGDKPVRNFRMIERHYFKDKLMQARASLSSTRLSNPPLSTALSTAH